MKARAEHLHEEEVEEKQQRSLREHTKQRKGDQIALEKLRPLSGVLSKKRSYLEMDSGKELSSSRKQKRPRLTAPILDINSDRLAALKNRAESKRPKRYIILEWKNFRSESIRLLSPYYPQTDLHELATWIEENHLPAHSRPLSAQKILAETKRMQPHTEIASLEELRLLMKVLAFKWGHLHSNYYIQMSRRPDVIAHRHEMIPVLRELMTNPNFFLVDADWSFEYQNDFSKSGWISLAIEDSDLVPARPGHGPRLAFCEFVTSEGVLRHPDGQSAGTVLQRNETLTAAEILSSFERGFESIANHPLVKKKKLQPVLLVDSARNQTTKSPDYLNPNEMNLSDGGKNRVLMAGIGLKGLKTVLSEHNQWEEGMSLAQARDKMWASEMVRQQRSELEALGRRYGVIVLYNSKAHPWFAFVERFWRWIKMRLQNLFTLELIRSEYTRLIGEMMEGAPYPKQKFQKWFNLALKYTEYYARGGLSMKREAEMSKMEIEKVGRLRPNKKFRSREELAQAVHNLNFIAFRGKHYSEGIQYW